MTIATVVLPCLLVHCTIGNLQTLMYGLLCIIAPTLFVLCHPPTTSRQTLRSGAVASHSPLI
jgi:hypothetical protein